VLAVEGSLSLLQRNYNIPGVGRQKRGEKKEEEKALTQRAQRKSTEVTEKRGERNGWVGLDLLGGGD
jgi:hypothetical protein